MLVHRDEIAVETADGVAPAWVHRVHHLPDGGRAAVLMYPDAFGVRPAMHEMADRLACLGYLVLVPNVFYRAGAYPPFDKATVFSDPPERETVCGLGNRKNEIFILPRIGGAVSGSRTAYEYLPESVRKFPNAEGLADKMREARFSRVEFERMTGGIVTLHVGVK